jgi:PhzF family phenazine biosynthesis protein
VPAAIVAAVGGIDPADIIHSPRIVSTGLPFCITLLRDRAALDRVRLNQKALNDYFAHLGQDARDMMEPYWITLEGASEAGDTYARLLLAPPSPPEDPFTGSATGAAASYLWSEGLIEGPSYVAEQGHGMGRPGAARVEVLGPADGIEGVRVSGEGAVVMSGTVYLPGE